MSAAPTTPSKPPDPAIQPSLFLPIARYSLSDADAALLDKAVDISIGQCMAGFGMTWKPSSPGAQDQADRRYGVIAADEAARYGYHQAPQPADSKPSLSPDEQVALIGPAAVGKPADAVVRIKGRTVPSGGCQQQGQQAVRPEAAPLPGSDVASGISGDGYQQSIKDPTVQKVFRSWSQCMKAGGYSYADPLRAVDAFASAAKVTQQEKAVAATDVACKEQVHLVTVWLAAESRIERAMITPRTAVLAPVLTRHHQQVARAEAIIAGAATGG